MTWKRRLLIGFATLLVVLVAYLLLWPVPISPTSWTPLPSPSLEKGPYQRNTALSAATIIDLDGSGPEDVAVDDQGRIYGGLMDGRIMRRMPDGGSPELFVHTKGRPLGMDFDNEGNLVVADAKRGLLRVDRMGNISVLATEHGDRRFGFTDDVDVGADGRYYFSDASSKWDVHHVREDFFEHRPYGRLLVYDPRTKVTNLLLDDLYFANGVAVSEDASFVLIVETSKYRVKRLWLTGPKKGEVDMFVENLPGFPDGISTGDDGEFWLALFSPRLSDLDSLLPSPWLRTIVYRLPLFLQPDPLQYGFILGLDSEARVIANLQDSSASSFSPITSVERVGQWLYLGSLTYKGAARLPMPPISQQ